MQFTTLPGTGISVSRLCLGTMTFGSPVSEPDAIRLVHDAAELGVNFIDTANMYEGYNRFAGSAGGVAEEIVGKAVAGRRADFVVATKLGMKVGDTPVDENTSPEAIRVQLRRSLRRINTDYIDLYYLHRYDPNTAPGEIARAIGEDPWKAFFDLCQINNCSTGGVYSSMCDEDVCEIIRDPYCIVGSDGLTRSWKEKGHPRASGTFPHVITYFVKEKKILTLEEAVNKMTGRTAEYLRIKNKGLIKEGYDADLVIFDYDKLQDTATYSNSNSITEGIDSVYVNGVLVYKDKQFTGAAPGKMLRHNA